MIVLMESFIKQNNYLVSAVSLKAFCKILRILILHVKDQSLHSRSSFLLTWFCNHVEFGKKAILLKWKNQLKMLSEGNFFVSGRLCSKFGIRFINALLLLDSISVLVVNSPHFINTSQLPSIAAHYKDAYIDTTLLALQMDLVRRLSKMKNKFFQLKVRRNIKI